MMVLLDEDERASQQAFLFGPPPLGPDAPPLDRLVAFGRERICVRRTPTTRCCRRPTAIRRPATTPPPRCSARTCGCCWSRRSTTGDLDAQTDALLALLDADYVEHQLNDGGHTLQTLGDAWESLARKLCGR